MSGTDTEPGARRALFEYMSLGPSVAFGTIPPERMDAWVTATDGVRLTDYGLLNSAWMRIEAATTFDLHASQGNLPDVAHTTPGLMADAEQRLTDITLKPANDALLRTRATEALGGVRLYNQLHGTAGKRDVLVQVSDAFNAYTEAGELLLRLLNRRRDKEVMHEAQVLSFLGLLALKTEQVDLVPLPLPTRLDVDDNELSVDMLLWNIRHSYTGMQTARVTSQAGDALYVPVEGDDKRYGHLTFSPLMLNESGYPSASGHGMLQAVVDANKPGGKYKTSRQVERDRYFGEVLRAIFKSYGDQVLGCSGLSLEVDPITGLDEARAWYGNIGSLRRLMPHDVPALEQCINPFENAFWAGELSGEDLLTLGWLHTELGIVTGDRAAFDRAWDVHSEGMRQAETAGDWPAYYEARTAKITSWFYKVAHDPALNEAERSLLIEQHCGNLSANISGLQRRLAMSRAGSAEYVSLQRLLEQNMACLVLSTDETYAATVRTGRQAVSSGQQLGFDVLVMPNSDGMYRTHASGRLRFGTPEPSMLPRGIASVDPSALRPLIESFGEGEDAEAFVWNLELAEQTRAWLLAAVEPVVYL